MKIIQLMEYADNLYALTDSGKIFAREIVVDEKRSTSYKQVYKYQWHNVRLPDDCNQESNNVN